MKDSAELLKNIEPFSGPKEQQLVPANKTAIQVKTGYTTAVGVREHRNIKKVRDNLLLEARLAGESFYYRWTVRTKTGPQVIEGPSVDLAMAIARYYGNCAVDIDVDETPTHWIFKATFIDLESGFTLPRLFQQRKAQSLGKRMDAERAMDLVFQVGQSKAQRNAIIKAMPAWLINRAMEVARESAIASIPPEKLAAARKAVLDFFAQYGIDQDRLEHHLGKPIETLTADDVADLRATKAAIVNGQVNAWDAIPPIPEEKPKKEAPAASAKKESMTAEKPKEAPTEESGIDDKDRPAWDRSIWARMRKGKPPKTGFGAYVLAFKDDIERAPDDVLEEMREKWANLYGDAPFPIGSTQGGGQDDEGSNESPFNDDEASRPHSSGFNQGSPGIPKPPAETRQDEPPIDAYEESRERVDTPRTAPKDESLGSWEGPFFNVPRDWDGAGELIDWVRADDQRMDVWNRMLADYEFKTPDQMDRVKVFINGQIARYGSTLGTSK